jgi:hypothetical protein
VRTGFWVESLKERVHSEDKRRWEDNIKTEIWKLGFVAWIGFT